jgi:hypothetical protein
MFRASAVVAAAPPSAAAAAAATNSASAADLKALSAIDAAAALFHSFIAAPTASAPLHSGDSCVAELRRLCLVRALDDAQRYAVVWKALLVACEQKAGGKPSADEKQRNALLPWAITTHARVLKKVHHFACLMLADSTANLTPHLSADQLAASNVSLFFQSFEQLVTEHPKLMGYTPHALKALYEAEYATPTTQHRKFANARTQVLPCVLCSVLGEEDVLKWHAAPLPSAASSAVRAKAAPFVEWLKAAESDDEA